jgi:hypothetical protein
MENAVPPSITKRLASKNGFLADLDFYVEQVFLKRCEIGVDTQARSFREDDAPFAIWQAMRGGEFSSKGGRLEGVFA